MIQRMLSSRALGEALVEEVEATVAEAAVAVGLVVKLVSSLGSPSLVN